MAEVDLFASQHQPLVLGRDDGSEARFVFVQAYAYGLRKGQSGWVVGTLVEDAIYHHILAPAAIADADPDPDPAPESDPDEDPIPEPEDPAEPDVPDADPELTYDLDAEPVVAKRGPGRPRKVTA